MSSRDASVSELLDALTGPTSERASAAAKLMDRAENSNKVQHGTKKPRLALPIGLSSASIAKLVLDWGVGECSVALKVGQAQPLGGAAPGGPEQARAVAAWALVSRALTVLSLDDFEMPQATGATLLAFAALRDSSLDRPAATASAAAEPANGASVGSGASGASDAVTVLTLAFGAARYQPPLEAVLDHLSSSVAAAAPGSGLSLLLVEEAAAAAGRHGNATKRFDKAIFLTASSCPSDSE